MIITLIKNAETIKPTPESASRMTNSGVSTTMKDSFILLHLCGKRPLYTVSNNGEYHLNVPNNEEKLPMPDLILTGSDINSYKTGKILNEMIEDMELPKSEIKSGQSSNNPKVFMEQHPEVKHLVVVGSEFCLKKWEKELFSGEDLQEKSPSMRVVRDKCVIFDSVKSPEFYMIDGIMDTLLLKKLNSNDTSSLSEDLKPFAKKVKGFMPLEKMILKINQATK